jgi:UDP-glucuronate 4-epimerase
MTVLVTGSSGFLATYFRAHNSLRDQSFIYGTTSQSPSPEMRKFARDYSDVSSVLSEDDVDYIVHLAAEIPASFAATTFEGTFLPNVRMMNNLYDFALTKGVKKFIYISTFGSMTDAARLDIKDFYTASKISSEHFCAMLTAQGIQSASLRISSPYGEYANKQTVLNLFVKRALNNEDLNIYGTGSRSQNFVYAGDVVQAIERCFAKDINGVYSILGARNTPMLELAETAVKATGSQSRIVVGEKPDPQEGFSFPHSIDARTRTELGYEPTFDLRTGMQRYVSWLKQHELVATTK